MTAMRTFLTILLALDMAAVVAVLLAGAVGMANANRDPRTSNKLMRWRVILQGIAIGLVALLMTTGR
jgi:hypoxia induced protein